METHGSVCGIGNAMPSRELLGGGDAAADTLFAGPSTMHARCRAFDWATTPLGPVTGWPQSLRTVAGLVLGAGYPTILLWGPDLVQLYNDGYVPFLGAKHPAGLGRPRTRSGPRSAT